MVWTTTSAEETRGVGRSIGQTLGPGDVVLLQGDLGAGKTTLTKGIADALGVAEEIQSPTFTVVAEYPAPGLGPQCWLVHVDLYRLAGARDLASIGLEEALDRDDAVVVIEWPEHSAQAALGAQMLVHFKGTGDERTITVARLQPETGH
jgi:tRNA threonylcarbamoyladenosine biosynthesis protein TsaE